MTRIYLVSLPLNRKLIDNKKKTEINRFIEWNRNKLYKLE